MWQCQENINEKCEGHNGLKRIECYPAGSKPIRARYFSGKKMNLSEI